MHTPSPIILLPSLFILGCGPNAPAVSQSDLDNLREELLTEFEKDIETLRNENAQLRADLEAVDGDLRTDLNDVQSEVDALTKGVDLTDLQASIDDHETRIGTLEDSSVSTTDLTASLADYTTTTDLTSTLADYVTTTDLSSTLGSYVTSSSLTSTLGGYVTSSSLTSTLGSYVTSSTLGSYVTSSSLTSTLGSYVTSSSLTSTLGSYVTSSSLTSTLSGYATTSALSAVESDVSTIESDYLMSADVEDVVRIISADETWSVSTASALEDAVADLSLYRIASDATLTIEIASGAYSMSGPLIFRHPDGGRIRVEGDLSSPANVSLLFPSGSAGIVVDEGNALGFLGGLSLQGYGATGDEIGILVEEHGMLTIGPMEIEGFYGSGIYVRDGSFIEGDEDYYSSSGWLTIADGFYGVYVSMSSGAVLPYVEVSDALSQGITASRTSYVYANESVVDNSGERGINADSGSFLEAEGATSNNNGSQAIAAVYHSGISAPYLSSSGSTYGALADWNSTLYMPSSVISASSYTVFSSIDSLVNVSYSTVSVGSGLAAYSQQHNAFILAGGASSGTVSTNGNDTTDFVHGN